MGAVGIPRLLPGSKIRDLDSVDEDLAALWSSALCTTSH